MTDDVDKDTVFPELELWDGKNGKLTGSYHIQPGYSGKLTAKVYNVYQLDTLSNTVELEADDEAPDDEEDNALIEEQSSDDEINLAAAEEEAAESDWIIGGEVPAVDNSAIANAINKNTKSKVKDSYTGFLIAGLVAAVTIAVAAVLMISAANERRREKRRREKRDGKDVFDWADKYNKD